MVRICPKTSKRAIQAPHSFPERNDKKSPNPLSMGTLRTISATRGHHAKSRNTPQDGEKPRDLRLMRIPNLSEELIDNPRYPDKLRNSVFGEVAKW